MAVCTRCVMSSEGDPTITFDEAGQCNYCTAALRRLPTTYFPGEAGKAKLDSLLSQLKTEGKGKEFDCLMGISGGLDSSYLAYLGATRWGLRILSVHVDDGFDTDISKRNIQRLANLPNHKMITVAPDAKQFNELTRAFLLAGVPNLAIPQDDILFSYIYDTAKQYGLRSFLSGGNFALESILQKGNTHDAADTTNIHDINRRFGRDKLDKLSLLTPFQRDLNTLGLRINNYRPLNYIDYNAARARKELADGIGFEYYGSKHLENTLTKFIQVYWFYHKFGVDKRRSHLSSLIVSGQITREEALAALKAPLYDEAEIEQDIQEVLQKLDLSREAFDSIMSQPPHQHTDYRTSPYLNIRRKILRLVRG